MKLFKNFVILLYTIYAWGFVVLIMISHFLLSQFFSLFYEDKELCRTKLATFVVKLGFKLLFVPLHIVGAENIPENERFILVCNHQSHMDIPVIIAGIHRHVAFIAKKELFKIPILGWDLRSMGHIKMDRQNARAAFAEMQALKDAIVSQQKSILFFPEGTRTRDGKLGQFKNGAFKLAIQTDTAVLPCLIEGTSNLLNRNSLLMKPAKVVFKIGRPIKLEPVNDKKAEKEQTIILNEMCKAEILKMHN
jgi:1-acyl-sn-glycerol-3-phosphate acyltransferase